MNENELKSSHTLLFMDVLSSLVKKRLGLIIPLVLFLGSLILYASLVPMFNIGDGFSIYITIDRLGESGDFNFWNVYNDEYNTPFFSYTYNDIVIKDIGEIFPLQFVGIIVIYNLAAQLGGLPLFYLVSPFFGALSVVGVYFLTDEIFSSRIKSIVPAIILAVSPLFMVWSIFPSNTVISTTFFIYALLFFIRLSSNFTVMNSVGFILSVVLMIITRYPHVLIGGALMILLVLSSFSNRIFSFQFPKRQSILIVIITTLLTIGILLLFNYLLFGDPFFIAYLQKNNVPVFGDDLSIGVETYLWDIFSLTKIQSIFNYVLLFIIQSNLIFPFFAVSWLGILLIIKRHFSTRNKGADKITLLLISFLFSLLFLIIFYGASSDVFYNGHFSMTLPHFRYLLPLYSLLPILTIPALELLHKTLEKISTKGRRIQLDRTMLRRNSAVIFLILTLILPTFISFNYGQISWIEDIDQHIEAYHIRNSLPPSGSVIMYGDRWPLLLLMQHNEDYTWFFYIGIPERYRVNETTRILNELLHNNESVIFFSSRYDSESAVAIFQLLQSSYILSALNYTYIERLDGIFYQVTQ